MVAVCIHNCIATLCAVEFGPVGLVDDMDLEGLDGEEEEDFTEIEVQERIAEASKMCCLCGVNVKKPKACVCVCIWM